MNVRWCEIVCSIVTPKAIERERRERVEMGDVLDGREGARRRV